jgi:hypothetical protein
MMPFEKKLPDEPVLKDGYVKKPYRHLQPIFLGFITAGGGCKCYALTHLSVYRIVSRQKRPFLIKTV